MRRWASAQSTAQIASETAPAAAARISSLAPIAPLARSAESLGRTLSPLAARRTRGAFSRHEFGGMIESVNAIAYPVAANPEQALSRPKGRAAREREAKAVAGEAVSFATEAVGP